MENVGVAKWSYGLAYPYLLKGLTWVKNVNLLVCSSMFCPTRQSNGPKYMSVCFKWFVHFLKIK